MLNVSKVKEFNNVKNVDFSLKDFHFLDQENVCKQGRTETE